MNGNSELLNFIYQNSQMGVGTINHLLEIVEDKKFIKHLQNQLDEYEEINKIANRLLNDNGYDEKGIGTLEKLRTYLMINFQTLTNKSSSHIAEMLIIGSNMGIIDAIKNIRKYQNETEKDILNLMRKLLKIEEKNIEELKEFL